MITNPRGARPVRPGRRPRLFGDYNGTQKLFIVEAMLMNSATVITGGVFLTGLLVYIGASDQTVGFILSSGSWSLMLSLLSSVVVERVRRKKALLAAVIMSFRLLTTLPAFLPLCMGRGPHTAALTTAMMVAGNLILSVFNTGFPVYFMDALPRDGRAGYIYARLFYIRIAYTVLSVAMGFLMDALGMRYGGLVFVFSVGLALGVADLAVFLRIPGDTGEQERQPTLAGLGRRLLEPFANKPYLRFLLFTFFYFFFYFMCSSYTALYMKKYLNLTYIPITLYNTSLYVIMILMTHPWLRIEAKIGRRTMLALTAALMAADAMSMMFLTGRTLWILVLSAVLNGFGSSGLWACVFPYRYDLMPQEGKLAYEGWYGFLYGMASLLGAFAGGRLQMVLQPVRTPFMTFSVFQIIYGVAGLSAMVVSLLFLAGGRKERA